MFFAAPKLKTLAEGALSLRPGWGKGISGTYRDCAFRPGTSWVNLMVVLGLVAGGFLQATFACCQRVED